MSKGLTIPLSLDPAEWIRGIRVVERTAEDLGDELEDVEDAGDKIAEGLEDGLRDAARAGDRFESALEDNMRDVRRAADRTEDAFDDLNDEVGDSAREFGSAFRGDPVEALEEVQSLAANLTQRYIPGMGGAVAAITGGVVFSGLIAFYERWKEEQEAVNERVRGFRDQILDAMGVVTQGQLRDALVAQLDEAGVSASEFELILARTPPQLRDGFKAALESGDLQGMLTVSEQIDAAAKNINQKFVSTGASLTPGQQAVLELNDALGGTVGELSTAVSDAQSLARVFGNDVVNQAKAAGAAIDAATQQRTVTITTELGGAYAGKRIPL